MTNMYDPNSLICPDGEAPYYSGVDVDGDGHVEIVENPPKEESLNYSPPATSPVSIPPAPHTPQYAESRYDPEPPKLKSADKPISQNMAARIFAPLAVVAAPLTAPVVAAAILVNTAKELDRHVQRPPEPVAAQNSRGNNANAQARDEAKNFWFAARARAAWEGKTYNVEYARTAFANIVAAGGLSQDAQRLIEADLGRGGGRNMREMSTAYEGMARIGRRMMESPLGGVVRAVSDAVINPVRRAVEQVASAVSRPVQPQSEPQPVRRVYALEDARDDEQEDGVPLPVNPEEVPAEESPEQVADAHVDGGEAGVPEEARVALDEERAAQDNGPVRPAEEPVAQAQRANEQNNGNQERVAPAFVNVSRANNVSDNHGNEGGPRTGAAGVVAGFGDGGEGFVGIPVGNTQAGLAQNQFGVEARDGANNQVVQGPVANIPGSVESRQNGNGVVGEPRDKGNQDDSSHVSYVAVSGGEGHGTEVSASLASLSDGTPTKASGRGVGINSLSGAPVDSSFSEDALRQARGQGGAAVAAAASHGDSHRNNNPVASDRGVQGEAKVQSGRLAGVFDKSGGGAGSQSGHENGRGSADIVRDILAANEIDEAGDHLIDDMIPDFDSIETPVAHDVVV